MKVLAINSSPRTGGRSKTELMLNHLVEGMRDAGAHVAIVNLREKKIKSCLGCYTCWTKTPGRCIQQDDMTREIYPQWLDADLAVYATPLYYHKMNSTMSAFVERTLPAAHPFFERDSQGQIHHPLREKVPAAAWLSVCGLSEASEFDAFSEFLNRTRHPDVSIVAEIYRPAAETLMNPVFQDTAVEILAATTQAGRELATSMAVAPDTLAKISKPFIDAEAFMELGNAFWKTCQAEGVTPKIFAEKNMVPRPDSMKGFMMLFPAGLNKAAVGRRTVVLQFRFSGEIEEACYFTIAKSGIDARPGVAEHPDITIDTPFALWMDIMTRKADGQQMFMEQQYQVEGDLALMIELFKRDA